MKMIFKRSVIAVLLLMLVIALTPAAFAAQNGINFGVSVRTVGEVMTVTVAGDNAAAFEQLEKSDKHFTFSTACSFQEAYAVHEGTLITSSLADGEITFSVQDSGDYQIINGKGPVVVETDGAITVTVTQQNDTYLDAISIPCEWTNVRVTLDQMPVQATAENGKVTIPVSGYGNYVITADDSGNETLSIVTQPVSAEAVMGENVTVKVIARGKNLKYQWYIKNAGSKAFSKSSITTDTYTVTMDKSRAGRELYCVITDGYGNSVTTDTVKLTAVPSAQLTIVTQPNDASAKLNENFCVRLEAIGDGLKYQWYWRNVGSENWNISGQRDNTYDDVMTAARHNREVKCVITDAWGNSVETETALITGEETVKLAITRQPEGQTVTLGEMFNVTFDAVGDGLKYQWYFMNEGDNKWYKSAQKDNSYDDVMTKPRHSRSLYCVVTDAWGNTVQTEPIVVITATQRDELAIIEQPVDVSAKLDENFCVTVKAQGDELKYQWYWRNKGSESWNISGQRDNTYDDVMTKARHNREVKCVITDMWGNSVESAVATITATASQELTIVTQPTDVSAAIGENFCVTVEAHGEGLTYTWYFKNAGSKTWNKSGVKDNTYDDVMTKARAGRVVYCIITDILGNQVTTDAVTLNLIK